MNIDLYPIQWLKSVISETISVPILSETLSIKEYIPTPAGREEPILIVVEAFAETDN